MDAEDVDYPLQMLTEAGFPAPQDLLGRKVKIGVDIGEIWTTIVSVSTIANDDGFPELCVAPAYFRGDIVVSIEIRGADRFFLRYKFWSNGKESSEVSKCDVTLI